MLEFEFIVPDRLDDLSEPADDKYYVYDIIDVRDLIGKIQYFTETKSYEEDNCFIFENFDVFFSILKHFPEIDEKLRVGAYKIILEITTDLISTIRSYFESSNNIDSDSNLAFKLRNSMKMVVFLLTQFTEAFESELLKPSIVMSTVKKKSRITKKDKTNLNDYENLRDLFVIKIIELCELPIEKLFTPPALEYQFVNVMATSFFKLFENNSCAKDDALCLKIIDYLGSSLKKHGGDLPYCIKILDLVSNFSHLPITLARAIQIFLEKYNKHSLIIEILRELSLYNYDEISRDTPRIHSISTFLIELSSRCTTFFMKPECIDMLLPYLEEESHIMRNCIISIILEIIIKISQEGEKNDIDILPHEYVENLKEKLINALFVHILDVNAFVRCKVIEITKKLVEIHAIPLYNQVQFLKAISGRLRDKASVVRKNAIRFLKGFLVSNPFTVLSVEELKENYIKERNKLEEERKNKDSEEKDNVLPVNSIILNSPEKSEENESISIEDKVKSKQDILVDYLKLTLEAAEVVVEATKIMHEMLKSTVLSDVIEAIEFLTAAFQLGLTEAAAAIKEMLRLVFSTEESIRNSVIGAYRTLYFTSPKASYSENENESAAVIAKNLILFLQGATENEVLAMEQFIVEFVKTGDITSEVWNILWQTFQEKLNDENSSDCYSSLLLLSMGTRVDEKIISKNLSSLIEIGFSSYSNFQLLELTFHTLLGIKNSSFFEADLKKRGASEFRLPNHHIIFKKILIILLEGISSDINGFCPMAKKGIMLIFKLADKPEILSVVITKAIIKKILQSSFLSYGDTCQYSRLKTMWVRFLFVCGEIILCYTLYLENEVTAELKRREKEHMKNELEKAKLKKERNTDFFSTLPVPYGEKDQNEDLEFQGAEAEDEIVIFISKLLDEEVLSGDRIFGILYEVILSVCKASVKYFDKEICCSSSLALGKFMCCNYQVCEENMQLMMTILEKSTDENIRSNIMICMTEILFRYPNVIQPWCVNLFKRLKDESPIVRHNTLVLLCHAIVHDLIKIKGQISDISLCLVDDSDDISNMAKYLFKEMSKKKNALYNLLPDLISGLSHSKSDVSEEHFQIIIKYVFQFIGKEKDVEGLVEKLCSRLKDIESPCQLHKVMFSLNLLTMNEKCVRKLLEHKDAFKNKSEDEIFLKYLQELITNVKKHNIKLEEEINLFAKDLGVALQQAKD